MKRFERAAVLISLMEELESQGSWCGETHIQKSTFFLQKVTGVPLGFNFIMYKHGPFSFDLRQELTNLRADRFITVKIKEYKYPGLQPTEHAEKLKKWHHGSIEACKDKVHFIASRVGTKNVQELEKLGTALFVKSTSEADADENKMISRFLELKPHLSEEDGRNAFTEVNEILHEAESKNLI